MKQENYMTEEWVDIVDASNNVIDAVPRSVMRQQRLLHRATYIVIENALGQLYVQRRTATKDYCPSMLDACCGGVVSKGEEIQASAYRELAEEMGITNVPLKFHGSFLHQDNECNVWGAVFSCQYDGELVLQQEEVEYVLLMTTDEIQIRASEFTADSLAAIQIWLTEADNQGHDTL
ncbi:NUDIX hydrolase YfcD [uncultured Tolumonas sp.]|uniref:NUDIX hydrolase YfcD n=1 Tax=uncultured Tolumonas sp. TaxID=263765 RepID=UPI002A0A11B9|nr:NUDIX hydrolase YfcD [uncultured Tolumonas sp.]